MTVVTVPGNGHVTAVRVTDDEDPRNPGHVAIATTGMLTFTTFVDAQALANALARLGYVAKDAPGTRYRDSDGDTWTVQADGTLTCSCGGMNPARSLAEIESEWNVTLRKLGDDE